jgi:hypothetical protein
MPFASRILAAGNSPLSSTTIAGDVASGLAATGSSTTDALQLSAVYNVVSTTAASTGVKLPTGETGALVVVANDGASTLTVYPVSGTIDGSTSASIATTKRRIFVGVSPTVWVSILGA